MIASLAKIALVSVLAILAGLPIVAPGRGRPNAGDLAAAWTVTLGNTAVLALAAGLAGLTLSPMALVLLLAAPGAAAAVLGQRSRRQSEAAANASANAASASADSTGGGALLVLSRIALLCALVTLAIKLAETPLWSWDHFAVWGVKARRMLEGGHLRLDFLRALYQTRTDHPLGLPMAWLVLTLGEPPDPAVFKVLHALFALALVAALHAAVRRVTSSAALANAAAAFLAVSPLLWDSEAVGLAEMPMALWAMVSLLLVLPALAAPLRRSWVPGLALGFLPWVKQEGLVLGLLLLAAMLLLLAVLRRASRAGAGVGAAWPALCAPALGLMAAALAVQKLVLPPGVGFFIGDWRQRGIERLPLLIDIQRRCLSFLLQPDWLGFWIAFAALTCMAVAKKKAAPLALMAVVWIQVLIYELTAVFTYLPPPAHLDAAFFRICAPLLPIGLLAMALLPSGAARAARAARSRPAQS